MTLLAKKYFLRSYFTSTFVKSSVITSGVIIKATFFIHDRRYTAAKYLRFTTVCRNADIFNIYFCELCERFYDK